MRISRIKIRNFRNFAALGVPLGDHAVIVGDNKIGNPNIRPSPRAQPVAFQERSPGPPGTRAALGRVQSPNRNQNLLFPVCV